MNFEDYESLPTSSVATHMTAGAFAGVMEHCIMYPLDSVKTRMQSLVVPKVSDGVSQTLVRMMKQEGVMRPVRGMPAMIVGAGPAHAFYFSSYEYLKTTMTNHTHSTRYHPLIHGLSGCISTIFHDAIMNPAEVVKQRMQMYNSPYHSVIHCMRKIYKAEGFRAFYRSYTTQLTMNIPFQSIHFMVYEFAQKITNKERKYNPSAHVVSGAMAGAIAAAITTPLDVCKTLLNTQQGGTTTGLVEALKTVYRLGGPTGFFRGIQARVLFQMPATAICWTTYEFFKYVITNKLDDMRLVTPGPVYAEAEKLPPLPTDDSPPPSTSSSTVEKVSLKPRELPAMSGAGLYGSISFNTMHTADTNFTSRRNDTTILDMTHT